MQLGLRRLSGATLLLAALSFGSSARAQEIVLDRPVRAGELVFFPTVSDAKVFYYAPTQARLATGETGKPEFSMLRYVSNVIDTGSERREGEGGGIVHAVVELGVTQEKLDEASRELGRKVSGADVRGPVIFRSGKFGLVTSFTGENGELATRVVGLGTAPVLEGGKAAVSILLTKLGAKVLRQSFETATPDISFMFEMEMEGYRSPKRAIIVAEVDRVYEHRAFELGVATTYVQAEIKEAFDELREQKAIRLEQVGEDEKLEVLAQTAYSKLIELLFQPATQQADQIASAGGSRKSALDRASELLEKRREETRKENERIRAENARAAGLRYAASRIAAGATAGTGTDLETADLARRRGGALNLHASRMPDAGNTGAERQAELALPEFAAVVSYEMKRSRQTGTYRVDLNKWTADTLALRFDENIGDLTRYLDDPAVFRDVNLDDPLYRQREVIASLAGVQDRDFDDVLSFASLQLRKEHGSGDETLEEKRIDRTVFNGAGNSYKLVYGWKGDGDPRKWREYQYRTLWAFHVGAPIEEEWRRGDFNAIQLTPPFRKRTVQLEAFDREALQAGGVRSVSVQVFSNVGGEERVSQVTLNTAREEFSKTLDFVTPSDASEYEYEIKWRLRGNQMLTSGRQKTDQDILYVDELPEA